MLSLINSNSSQVIFTMLFFFKTRGVFYSYVERHLLRFLKIIRFVNTLILIIHSSLDEHLGCFHFPGVVNREAMNTDELLSL